MREHRQKMAEESTEFEKAQGKAGSNFMFLPRTHSSNSARIRQARAGFTSPSFRSALP